MEKTKDINTITQSEVDRVIEYEKKLNLIAEKYGYKDTHNFLSTIVKIVEKRMDVLKKILRK